MRITVDALGIDDVVDVISYDLNGFTAISEEFTNRSNVFVAAGHRARLPEDEPGKQIGLWRSEEDRMAIEKDGGYGRLVQSFCDSIRHDPQKEYFEIGKSFRVKWES